MPEHDCVLRDERGQVVTIASKDVAICWLKQVCPDGEYNVEGPNIDLTFYRINGIVYPSGGMIVGKSIPPRSRAECVLFFDHCD
jgi:hypothetical protein